MTQKISRPSYWFHENASRFAVDAEPLGHKERPGVEKGEQDPNELRNWWARLRARYPEPLEEFLAVSSLSARSYLDSTFSMLI
jgi:hypothetical protein